MENARVLGNNITLLLNQKGISKEAFAKALGYSCFDVQKLCDARLLTTEEDIKDIADYFNVTTDELFTYRDDNAYTGEGFMHCMGKFNQPENREKILDIFDMYCNIKEALAD
ncbi:hypothetical protein Ccar_24325 [Clostridium carboxidivorans P7]|uniref:Uncharacterized protein n=1 Tax=Clostridium carboxidivorans P7 TaxID=536227 RepID=C6PV71_9CLOT|nr:helix-turn-helix transcriptional regulator [Clostridium carboxidivorans]AKN33781.1 hypothetical protein Ccar_24325 [Clostridium carboxidivorans P7]EET86889.1 hypothetical protein CcarbDRAFT_2688 [Clostridium carboxidivorans P7]EFG86610.1 hypothetical protein CLCAR_3557 [Clostridium carboxidivorans P7]